MIIKRKLISLLSSILFILVVCFNMSVYAGLVFDYDDTPQFVNIINFQYAVMTKHEKPTKHDHYQWSTSVISFMYDGVAYATGHRFMEDNPLIINETDVYANIAYECEIIEIYKYDSDKLHKYGQIDVKVNKEVTYGKIIGESAHAVLIDMSSPEEYSAEDRRVRVAESSELDVGTEMCLWICDEKYKITVSRYYKYSGVFYYVISEEDKDIFIEKYGDKTVEGMSGSVIMSLDEETVFGVVSHTVNSWSRHDGCGVTVCHILSK